MSQQSKPYSAIIADMARGRKIAVGSISAPTHEDAKALSLVLAQDADAVLNYTLGRQSTLDVDAAAIDVELQPVAAQSSADKSVATYSKFDFKLQGEPFFPQLAQYHSGDPTFPASRARLSEGKLKGFVQQILATDPAIRRARAQEDEFSWAIEHEFVPGSNGWACVGLKIESNTGRCFDLAGPTIRALTCVVLRANHYRRRSGMRYNLGWTQFVLPQSSVLRAGIRAVHLRARPHAWEQAKPALNYLGKIGRSDLAVELREQANAEVAP